MKHNIQSPPVVASVGTTYGGAGFILFNPFRSPTHGGANAKNRPLASGCHRVPDLYCGEPITITGGFVSVSPGNGNGF